MTRCKHVIWDWNGTVLDDGWLWVETMNLLLQERDMAELTEEQYLGGLRFPLKDYFLDLGFDFTKESFTKLALEFINRYEARWQECALHNDTEDVLRELAREGLSQSVLSAIQHDVLQKMIPFFRLADFFTDFTGIDDPFMASKLDVGKRHLQGLRMTPVDVVLIGDTQHDFEVASGLGVGCLLVAHGHNSRDKLLATGAKVLGSMREIQAELIGRT